jgi:DNA-binding MurR/RpiR family transcriptional regulator
MARSAHGGLRNGARYLLDNRGNIGGRRKSDVAAAAGVVVPILTKLAEKVGCLNYAELRALARRSTEANVDMVDAVLWSARDPVEELVRDVLAADIRNFEDTFENSPSASYLRATEILNASVNNRVVVFGRRSCFGAAHLFHYIYSLFRGNATLAQDAGGAGIDVLRWLGKDDVFLVIGLAPYTRETVQAVTYASQKGCKIIAITDNAGSPLAKKADAALYFDSATPAFFHSLTASFVIVQTLASLLFYGQEGSQSQFEKTEAQLKYFAAYDQAGTLTEVNDPIKGKRPRKKMEG